MHRRGGRLIRRKSPKNRSLLRYKQQAAIGIGKTRDQEKRERHAHRVEVIAANRAAVFLRDARCRRCQGRPRLDDHCHEVRSRALLRGLPPEEIFNTKNCLRLCAGCHLLVVHQYLEDIEYVDLALGCDGEVRFVPHKSKV